MLVSDDKSPESPFIEAVAKEHGVPFRGSRIRRSHFGGDLQSFLNALAFAEAAGADVAVKVSQRFIFRRRESIDAITKAFEDPNIVMVTPGQPKVNGGLSNGQPSNGFGRFTVLSDICAIRVGCISPADMLHIYRSRLMTEKVPWGSFLECFVDHICRDRFPGRSVKLEEITNHTDIDDPLFLRRYQNHPGQYEALAATHGIGGGKYPTGEWLQLEGRAYICKPLVI